MRKINITILIEDNDLIEYNLIKLLHSEIGREKIIDYVKFSNTEHLKDNNTFKKLLKAKRDAGRELDSFINNNRI